MLDSDGLLIGMTELLVVKKLKKKKSCLGSFDWNSPTQMITLIDVLVLSSIKNSF